MNFTLHTKSGDRTLYCYTGGKTLDASRPTVVFIHGVLHDHSVWILQSRYFANHGWNVLALDLPGHCRSPGAPPESVGEAADTVIALLDAAGIQKAALVGHSWGSLIALEAAARAPGRVSHLVLIGTASPMKVSPTLLDAALHDPANGIRMINLYSRSTLAAPPSALGPGTWVHGGNTALNHRVMASNAAHNVFFAGFKACDSYTGAEAAMGRVECKTLFILGQVDQMTPARAAAPLVKAAKQGQVVTVGVGHHQMTEAPEETLAALRSFLSV